MVKSIVIPQKIRQILLLALTAFSLRMLYVEGLSRLQNTFHFSLIDVFSGILSNSYVTVFMILSDIGLIYLLNKRYCYGRFPFIRLSLEFLSLILITIISTLIIVDPDTVFSYSTVLTLRINRIIPIVLGCLLFNTIVIVITDIFFYLRLTQKKNLAIEIGKKNKARLQYNKLKHQLNPHFLFNSLNVLDYLVHTDTERASIFIKKLASNYRYLLNNEEQELVFLHNEIKFAQSYFDLMKERFDKGLEIKMDIPAYLYEYMIVPCGLQLLIENATKHNVISSDSPLKIEVYTESDQIVVRNNLQPKLSTSPSFGMGLKNLCGQYSAMFGKEVLIEKCDRYFVVKIPLLNQD
ncbi:MAG: sensor histidine kinase [Bacteroidales bacterium]